MPGYFTDTQINAVRDMSLDMYETVTAKKSKLAELMLRNLGGFNPAKNNRHEWLEKVIGPVQFTVTGYTGGVATVVASNVLGAVEPQSIFSINTLSGINTGEQVKVVSVDTSANTITLTSYAGSSLAGLTAGSVLSLVANAAPDGSPFANGQSEQGTPKQNFTQIMYESVKMGGSAMETTAYGMENDLAYQTRMAMEKLGLKIAGAVLFGKPVQRTSGENGTMGGVSYFLNQAGANITDGGNNKVTNAMINTTLNEMANRGGSPEECVIVAGREHASTLTDINKANGGMVNIISDGGQATFGGGSSKFTSAVGTQHEIIWDNRVSKDTIMFINPSECGVVALGNRKLQVLPGEYGMDGKALRLLTEITLHMQYAKEKHAIIKGLTY